MHENDIYERQLNAQINYYKSITTSGYELRKIRHDYNDLSIGLKSLINSRKYDEVLPLLQKYDSEIISSFQILYNTGNDLTDAILSDKQKMQMKILKSLLRVRLQMCLPTTLKSAFCLTI